MKSSTTAVLATRRRTSPQAIERDYQAKDRMMRANAERSYWRQRLDDLAQRHDF
jgi:hypothetical protein